MRRNIFLLSALLILSSGWSGSASAQTFRRLGTEFNAVRSVNVSAGKKYAVIVTQFFHHGEIREDCRNLVVFPKNVPKPVPARVLQNGPGDFCRVAFQTAEGQNQYEILYGGEPPKEEMPKWTATQGLLLETREFRNCNLNSYNAVREAFDGSKRIGSDYVDGVHQAENPFTLKPGPFLTRYSGFLHIASVGTYGFITSSQDCSFVVIDDKPVTEQPGMHPPRYQATPGTRQDLKLAAGAHKFEYYHAAAGPSAIMVLAWEVSPSDPKPKPVKVPPEAYAAGAIGREAASPPSTRTEKLAPDFLVNVAGSVPLPDNETSLIGVQFLDASPKALASNSKFTWDFGDGQKGEQANPDHVYLRPGLYTVKLTIRHGGRPFEIANRVYIDEPKVTETAKFHQLDDYLRVLETYDARVMDAASLKQLVQAFQTKADNLLALPDSGEAGSPEPQPGAAPKRYRDQPDAAKKSQALRFIAAAVELGKAAFLEDSTAKGDEDLIQLARIVGPMARDQLGNAATAATIWQGATRKIGSAGLRSECLVETADVAVNDLVKPEAAKPLLDAATKVLGGDRRGPIANRFFRVWGDYYALTGDGKMARKAYNEAEAAMSTRKTYVERTAWQGARGRSTEQFLKTGEYDRAIAEIRQWQDDFPADKITGLVTCMYARYWAGREKHPQAIALAGQMAAVNPDSPYIDQMQMLVAECHLTMGAPEKAIATLESFIKGYPGSPLAKGAKERLAEIKSGDAAASKKPKKPGRPAEK
jgi:tetratricopeptide (TPR) repeat protein